VPVPEPISVTSPVDSITDWFSVLIDECEPDEKLDLLTRDAAKVFGVSMVMINLVTDDEIVFKACVGETQGKRIARSGAFCSLAVTTEQPLMVPNALIDPRFKNYQLVTGPAGVRAYLGKSLHAPDGSLIGTFCLFDTKPRTFSAEEVELLTDFATMADEQLALILSGRR